MPNFVCGKFLALSGLKTTLLRSKMVLPLGGVCLGYKPCLNMLEHEELRNSPEEEPSDELGTRTGHIALTEIKNSIMKLKNGKAPGCDKYTSRGN